MDDYLILREAMVKTQIAARGISDRAVLRAMATVPREAFIHGHLRAEAYADSPLPIDCGQTISQPFIVAMMSAALRLNGNEKVLEVGTGSGYGAAVLSRLCRQVFTIERVSALADRARDTLQRLGYDNVSVSAGDGTLGWPEQAPFDGIVTTAGGPVVPESLKEQLTIGGRLVIPVGDEPGEQSMLCVTRRSDDRFDTEELGAVRFVPLIGEQGWNAAQGSG